MASIVRPTLLRQTCLAAASKRAFSTKVSTSFPTVVRKTSPSILSRQSVRSAFIRNNAGSISVAAFHTSGRQAILPAGPRMSPIAFIDSEDIC
jgi:succinate dehydrogenase (ubiquinone) membrane anchor subunit